MMLSSDSPITGKRSQSESFNGRLLCTGHVVIVGDVILSSLLVGLAGYLTRADATLRGQSLRTVNCLVALSTPVCLLPVLAGPACHPLSSAPDRTLLRPPRCLCEDAPLE